SGCAPRRGSPTSRKGERSPSSSGAKARSRGRRRAVSPTPGGACASIARTPPSRSYRTTPFWTPSSSRARPRLFFEQVRERVVGEALHGGLVARRLLPARVPIPRRRAAIGGGAGGPPLPLLDRPGLRRKGDPLARQI